MSVNYVSGQPEVWVWKRCSFDSAHYLPNYEGPCRQMHGHTYHVELGVLCTIDPKSGMGVDLREVGEFLKTNVVSLFDHRLINDRLPGETPPTAEAIADYLMGVATKYFRTDVKIRVYETPDSWIERESMYVQATRSGI